MTLHRVFRSNRLACVAAGLALLATPAFAANRDMVQLQTQVQQLQDAVARLQQSNDERLGVLRDLVQQSADSVNKMSQTIDALQLKLNTQQEAATGKVEQVSGQVQTLNDSVDEVKARLNGVEKALEALQSQQQSVNAALQNMGPAAGAGTPADGSSTGGPSGSDQPTARPIAPDGPGRSANSLPSDLPFATQQGPPRTSAASVAPATEAIGPLYSTALSDFMAAKYSLATSEFKDITRNYPDHTLSGNAFYYLGEIDYRAGRYSDAVKNYDHVVQQFPANSKVPVSRLHKASALLALKDRQAAIAEMRSLIQRFPNSPEAVQARSKLNGMGVPISVRRPS